MSIEIPTGWQDRIDRLVAAVAGRLPGEPPEAVQRLVELTVLKHGIREAEKHHSHGEAL